LKSPSEILPELVDS